MRRQRLLVMLAATLVLTSCGGDTGGQAGRGPQIGVIDIAATPVDTLRDGGSFRWPLASFPANFNYNHLDGTYEPTDQMLRSVMPYIFLSQADGTVKTDDNYLTSAELTSTNPQVATYTVRDEAIWSDGTPITWRDFTAQWQALNGSNKDFRIASSTGYTDIASVERGTSDKQVVVTFARPFSDWQVLFNPLYPAATNTNPGVFNTGWIQRLPVTAGPYRVEQIDQTAKTITVVRDEKWWGRKPRLDRIAFRVIPDEAEFDALANNEIDFIDIGPDVNQFTRAQGATGVKVHKALAPNYRHITFNGNPGSILADQQLRIAIQKGINSRAIAQAQIGRIVPDPTPLGNHIFVQGQRGYQDNSQVVGYDPAEASRMLDALGWTRPATAQDAGTRRKNGRDLVIRDVIPAQVPVAEQESRQVQQFLSQIGVKVEITPVPTDDFFDKHIRPGNFDMTHFAWIGTAFPISEKGAIYSTRGDTQQNFGGIGNETINNLFAEASRELDPTRKIELANRIDQEIWKTGHSLLFYQRPNVIAVRDGVANFGAFGFADPVYTDIGFTR
ncbi:MAG TPA: ABC transporter family substrate-binding protein [Pseudonocardiaceae bacterium]|nr:ABC transporter family substrate-binding protein [Pseudonocardiaceae bacterium]